MYQTLCRVFSPQYFGLFVSSTYNVTCHHFVFKARKGFRIGNISNWICQQNSPCTRHPVSWFFQYFVTCHHFVFIVLSLNTEFFWKSSFENVWNRLSNYINVKWAEASNLIISTFRLIPKSFQIGFHKSSKLPFLHLLIWMIKMAEFGWRTK